MIINQVLSKLLHTVFTAASKGSNAHIKLQYEALYAVEYYRLLQASNSTDIQT